MRSARVPLTVRFTLILAALALGLMFWTCRHAHGKPPQAPPLPVGKPAQAPPVELFDTDAPTDINGPCPPGWEKVSVNGGPWYFRKLATQAAPAVAAPQPFRAGNFHAGHNCPTCGRAQFVVAGWNRDGTHNHVCTADGTVWRH